MGLAVSSAKEENMSLPGCLACGPPQTSIAPRGHFWAVGTSNFCLGSQKKKVLCFQIQRGPVVGWQARPFVNFPSCDIGRL